MTLGIKKNIVQLQISVHDACSSNTFQNTFHAHSTHSTLIQHIPRLFNTFHAHPTHSTLIQHIPHSFNTFHAHPTHSTLIQHIPRSFNTFHAHSTHSTLIQHIPCSFNTFHAHSTHSTLIHSLTELRFHVPLSKEHVIVSSYYSTRANVNSF